VQLNRGGKITAADAAAKAAQIALVYGLPPSSVVLEPLLTGESDRVRVLVLDDNPLQEVHTYPGPSLDRGTGRFTIGQHADRTSAEWELWRPGWGACHGMIAGTTGGGKSALLQVILAEARHCGMVVPWLGDPDNGSNAWKDDVDCYAGSVPRIRRMLQAAEAVMLGRAARWSRQRVVGVNGLSVRRDTSRFDPYPAEPMLLVVVDEAPEVLQDAECLRIIGRVGKRGRKLGVGVIIVTQVPSLDELGNALTVRSMLSSMNVVMFRTSDKFSAQMGSMIPVDPHNLPKQWPDGSTTAGLGYLGTGVRLAPFRCLWVPDGHNWATTGKPAVLGPADRQAALVAGRDYYLQWRDLLDVDPDDDQEELEETAAVLGAVPVDGTKRAAILTYLQAHGTAHTGVIAQRLNIPMPTVSTTLSRLAGQGLAVQVRRGVWSVPEHARESLEQSA